MAVIYVTMPVVTWFGKPIYINNIDEQYSITGIWNNEYLSLGRGDVGLVYHVFMVTSQL